MESLQGSLADAERRVYEGELVRRKLHNIIQVRVLLAGPTAHPRTARTTTARQRPTVLVVRDSVFLASCSDSGFQLQRGLPQEAVPRGLPLQ